MSIVTLYGKVLKVKMNNALNSVTFVLNVESNTVRYRIALHINKKKKSKNKKEETSMKKRGGRLKLVQKCVPLQIVTI